MTYRKKKTKPSKTAHRPLRSLEVIKHPPMTNSWRIAEKALQTLWQNKKIFSLISVVYLVLDLVLVHSVAGFGSLTSGGNLAQGLSAYSNLVAVTTGQSSASSGAYQLFLTILFSLVVIWTLRMVTSSRAQTPDLRSVFYKSTYPLVPFILILLLMGVQLLPFVLGSLLYSYIVGGGIAVMLYEQAIFLMIMLAMAALSIYWLTRTIVALYIVTLPDTTPLTAYRSAKELVAGRRLSIARKMIFLPIAMFVTAGIVIVPCIIIWQPLAQVLFYALSLLSLFAVHAYFYTMYRDLLNEA